LNDQLRTGEIMKALYCMVAVSIAFGQQSVKVVRQSEPEKALVFSVTVPTSRAEVWRAFSTSGGLSTWLTPGAVVDLRKGGEWTAHFPDGKTGGGTILNFIPGQEITISAMAPEQFPTVRAQRTNARFEFVAAGTSTQVTLIQTGWKDGEEWDKAYEYLAKGNAQLLETLRRRFVSGPIDWGKEWGN
jgi:uncharacterized protein YndB with AHSA1/START domain